jgi:hypothetical protein
MLKGLGLKLYRRLDTGLVQKGLNIHLVLVQRLADRVGKMEKDFALGHRIILQCCNLMRLSTGLATSYPIPHRSGYGASW